MKSLEEILDIVRETAWGASDILRSYYRGKSDDDLDIEYKKNEPVTAADLAVNKYILEQLQTALGKEDFDYISEETYKSQQSFEREYVWIIDPLDGTRDFIQKTGEYAIHIALVKNKTPVLAVVAIPEAEKIYCAIKGQGTRVETRDGKTQIKQVSIQDNPQDLTLVVSRSHRNDRLEHLLKNLPCTNQKAVGSVGGKIVAIIEQTADVYISLSGKSAPKDWDMAAPELILTEAGGLFTHFDGKPLQYNTGDINQWGELMASNGKCHETLCKQGQEILSGFEG